MKLTRLLAVASLMLMLMLALAACAANRPGSDESLLLVSKDQDSGSTQRQPAPAKPTITPGVVDRSCKVDADCAVKNVGNCCGYYPQCVNVDSPTFPDQVKAECEREGRSSICGFPSIESCQCVQGTCAARSGPAAGQETIRQ